MREISQIVEADLGVEVAATAYQILSRFILLPQHKVVSGLQFLEPLQQLREVLGLLGANCHSHDRRDGELHWSYGGSKRVVGDRGRLQKQVVDA